MISYPSPMDKQLLNAWADPIFKYIHNLVLIIRDTPGDASMLAAAAKHLDSIPLPDIGALAEDMFAAMARGANAELIARVGTARKNGIHTFAIAFDPIQEAIDKLGSKTPVASKLKTAEWERMPLALRERAQFSAGVESIRVMGAIQDKLMLNLQQRREQLSNGKMAYISRDAFIGDIRQIGLDEGLDTNGGNVLTNIVSAKRLGLIYDMQTESARGYTRHKLDNDVDALAVIPAWRFTGSTAKQPRDDWERRWSAAGGSTGWDGALKSEMVALKTSPIWAALSRFGTPWPPFDFGSTRELEDVWRDEAESLGLIKPSDTVEPMAEQDFNDQVEASVADLSPDQIAPLNESFGDQISIKAGKAQWQGTVVKDLVKNTLSNPQWNGKAIELGYATQGAIDLASSLGHDISKRVLKIDPGHIRKIWEKHGPLNAVYQGSGERDPSQKPLSALDYELIPYVWRNPDKINSSDKKENALIFEKNINGNLYGVGWEMGNRTVMIKSIYKKR